MFTGLSAFPLTPVGADGVDEDRLHELVARLDRAGVDSIGVLGSTGSYAYLTRDERRRVAETAVRAAGETPVLVGIGALATADVLRCAEDAQAAGAGAVLLAPVSYQPLTDDEVYGLFAEVTVSLSVPLCVYDNPATTHVTFSDDLHARIAALPHVGSIKIPATPTDPHRARERVTRLRAHLPDHVTIGVSGDRAAAAGLIAGCEGWYSVLGGVWPRVCLALTRAARRGDSTAALDLTRRLDPVWQLFDRYGSLRVASAIAEHAGLVGSPNLPRPVTGLPADAHRRVRQVVEHLDPDVGR